MSERTANHVCKACGKAYYACPDCDRINSWRSVACSPECYQEYVNQVLESRMGPAAMNKPVEGDTKDDTKMELLNELDSYKDKTEKTNRQFFRK